jgi:hypothetical protein
MFLTWLLACWSPAVTVKPEESDYAACTCTDADDDEERICTPDFPDACTDCDCDGSRVDEDCDDHDSRRTPGADETAYASCDGTGDGIDNDCDGLVDEEAPAVPAEVCDGADNDCDGKIDEGVEELLYYDADLDGWGGPDQYESCEGFVYFTSLGGDCDDTDPRINPGATERTGDGVDGDCDGDPDG